MQNIGKRLVQMSAIYMVLGLLLGFGMAVTKQFEARSVHTHLNLLGWMAMGLTGLTYTAHPSLTQGLLARLHFWMHAIGLPIMMLGLTLVTFGHAQFEPALGLGTMVTTVGLLLFGLNAFKRL